MVCYSETNLFHLVYVVNADDRLSEIIYYHAAIDAWFDVAPSTARLPQQITKNDCTSLTNTLKSCLNRTWFTRPSYPVRCDFSNTSGRISRKKAACSRHRPSFIGTVAPTPRSTVAAKPSTSMATSGSSADAAASARSQTKDTMLARRAGRCARWSCSVPKRTCSQTSAAVQRSNLPMVASAWDMPWSNESSSAMSSSCRSAQASSG